MNIGTGKKRAQSPENRLQFSNYPAELGTVSSTASTGKRSGRGVPRQEGGEKGGRGRKKVLEKGGVGAKIHYREKSPLSERRTNRRGME